MAQTGPGLLDWAPLTLRRLFPPPSRMQPLETESCGRAIGERTRRGERP